MKTYYTEEDKYIRAKKRVENIKGFYANLFRIITIIISVIATYYLQKKLGKKEIKKSTLWKNINSDFNTLVSNLSNSKISTIDKNKDYLLKLLTEEIVKRYVYREGLYDYYKSYDPEIKSATDILSNLSAYTDYLR